MRQVFILRHGSHDRLDRILCGRMSGVRLSETGRSEARGAARLIAARLGGGPLPHLFASPLERAQETAAAVADALGITVETEADLHEVDVGAWTGRPLAELRGEPGWSHWNAARGSARPPDGESAAEIAARMGALLDRFREDGPPVILVSHAEPIRVAGLALLGLGLDAYDSLALSPAGLCEFALWPGGGRLVAWNERSPA